MPIFAGKCVKVLPTEAELRHELQRETTADIGIEVDGRPAIRHSPRARAAKAQISTDRIQQPTDPLGAGTAIPSDA